MLNRATLLVELRARTQHLLEQTAWVLLALWAMVWLVFSVIAGVLEIGDVGILALLSHLLLPLMIIVVLVLGWHWPVIGAGSAIAASFVCMLWYGFSSWFIVALLDLPPLLAGLLLLVAWLRYSEELTIGPPHLSHNP